MVEKTSLNAFVSFSQILPLLSVPVNSTVLPATVQCPLCQKLRLRIYPDAYLDGEWHFCSNCKTQGDMIELAARVWKLGIPHTITKLIAAGIHLPESRITPESVQHYAIRYVEYRKKRTAFWEACQQRYSDQETGELRELQRQFGGMIGGADWADRGSFVMGAAHVRDVVGLVTPKWAETREAERADGTRARTGNRIFRGGGWTWVLVIPFYDLPGRITGFLCMGRGLDRAKDWLYVPCPPFRNRKRERYRADPGIAMLSTTWQPPHRQLGTDVIAITDVAAAARLQLRHMRESTVPLPIIIPYVDVAYETTTLWPWLQAENIIFWSPTADVSVLRQARKAGNARVSVAPVSPREIEVNMSHRTPTEWLRKIREETVTWQTALRRYLTKLSTQDVEATLLELELSGSELQAFIETCDDAMQLRLQEIVTNSPRVRRVQFMSTYIYERNGQWATDDTVVADGVVRIEQILSANNQRRYYRGTIRYAGQEYPFLEQTSTLEPGLFSWARQALLANGVGPLVFDRRWDAAGLDLAVLFHAPKPVTGVDFMGWDPGQSQFSFPAFTIARGGDVNTNTASLFSDDTVPGRRLVAPLSAISHSHVKTLSEPHPESQLFWATASCVIANIVATAVNQQPTGIVLSGCGAHAAGPATARALGCTEIRGSRRVDTKTQIRQHLGNHRWPAVFTNSDTPVRPGVWLDTPDTGYLLVSMSPFIAGVLGMRGTWNVIQQEFPTGDLQQLATAATQVLPYYLQSLASRRIVLPETSTSLVFNVLTDLAHWLASIGGNPNTVARAADVLRPAGHIGRAQYFTDLLVRLYTENYLGYYQDAFDPPSREAPAIIALRRNDRNGLWISYRGLGHLLRDLTSLPFDITIATAALTECGALLGEEQYRKEHGWFVDEMWWVASLERQQR